MQEYYRAEKRRTSKKHTDKTPYPKIILRQFIAAIICFLILNYICPANFKQKFKEALNYDINISETLKVFNLTKPQDADKYEDSKL